MMQMYFYCLRNCYHRGQKKGERKKMISRIYLLKITLGVRYCTQYGNEGKDKYEYNLSVSLKNSFTGRGEGFYLKIHNTVQSV